MDRRNVLFVIIDQLRADCLNGALADHVELPNLRALQADAVSFRRHYSATNPCGPSRASILTGQYAMNHRSVRNGTPLPHDVPNIATEMRRAGYLPQLFGYTDIPADPRIHDPSDPVLRSYEQVLPGFEQAIEMRLEESWPWRGYLLDKGYDVPPYPDIFRPDGDRPDDPAIYRAEDSDTAFLTDRTISELRARPKGWFAHLTYIRPHDPFVAPAPYNRLVDPAKLPLPKRAGDIGSEAARHPYNEPCLAHAPLCGTIEGFPDLEPTDANVQMIRALYLGLAAEVDHHIGRVIGFLKESGQYDDTLIVVSADHGEMLGDFHAWGKQTYYDAAYHTPLIIRDPRYAEQFGTAVDALTESVDVAPTILDLMGQDIPDTMNGRSLRPFLSGETPDDWRVYGYSELDYGKPHKETHWQKALNLPAEKCNLAILRDERFTFVHFNGDLPEILFDHSAEGETRNVAGEPEYQTTVNQMLRALLDHRMTHAQSLFSRTMITSDGAVRSPRVL